MREKERETERKRQSSESAKEKSLKKPENKGEGACLLPRWPYHWRRQELLINAKKSAGWGDRIPAGVTRIREKRLPRILFLYTLDVTF